MSQEMHLFKIQVAPDCSYFIDKKAYCPHRWVVWAVRAATTKLIVKDN
jgi:hypothetical protein